MVQLWLTVTFVSCVCMPADICVNVKYVLYELFVNGGLMSCNWSGKLLFYSKFVSHFYTECDMWSFVDKIYSPGSK